jgi:hypothetical protein
MANTKISALTFATTPLAGTEVLPIVQSSTTVKVAVSDLTAGRSISVSGLTNTGLTASKPVFTDASKVLTSTGVVPVANGGTNASAASITAFNNITGYTAAGATGTTSTNLVFSTSPSITTPTLVGDVTVSTGNVVIGTSGKGIDFSATPSTGTSELFADYEEGTWTPTLVFSGGAGTLSYATRIGKYTKIGRVVYFHMGLTFSKGTASGTLDSISGLPFAAVDSANGGGVWIDGMSLLSGATEYTVDSSTLYVYVSTTGSAAAINATNMGASSNVLRISGFYAI